MILATGEALATRLESLAGQLRGGKLPRCAGQWLTAGADKAETVLQRKATLQAILAMLDPSASQSLWQLAKSLESAIARLTGVPLRRIQSGHRPASELESLLMELLELPGPQTHEKLFQELRKLASRSE